MKLLNWLKSRKLNHVTKDISEEEIQNIHKTVVREIRFLDAEKRRDNFKLIVRRVKN